jgi:hypothetical protein
LRMRMQVQVRMRMQVQVQVQEMPHLLLQLRHLSAPERIRVARGAQKGRGSCAGAWQRT